MKYSTFRFLCPIALLILIACKNNTPIQQGYVADNDSCHARTEGQMRVYFSGDYDYPYTDKEKSAPSFQLYCDCMKERGWKISLCPKPATETKTVSPAPVAPVTATATLPPAAATATATMTPGKTTVTTTPSTTTITTTITSTPITTTSSTAPATVTVTTTPDQKPATMNITVPPQPGYYPPTNYPQAAPNTNR